MFSSPRRPAGQSEELKGLLENPHLRELLRSVDAADSKAEVMRAAMQEPLFVEFSDTCLKVVENDEYQEFRADASDAI